MPQDHHPSTNGDHSFDTVAMHAVVRNQITVNTLLVALAVGFQYTLLVH